jgi:hypothetical protein
MKVLWAGPDYEENVSIRYLSSSLFMVVVSFGRNGKVR